MSKRTILDHALPTETNAIINDAFDESTFQTIKQHATTLEESVAEGTEELATFEKLSQDIFSSLYKYNPKQRSAGELKESHHLNYEMVTRAMKSEQYAHLRQYTKLDDVNSALATVTIANNIIPEIKTILQEQAKRANELVKAEEELEGAKEVMDQFDTKTGHMSGGDPQTAKERRAAKTALVKAQKKYDKGVLNNQNTAADDQAIRQVMRKAEKQALDDIYETNEMLEMWGTDAGSKQALSPEERIRLAQRVGKNDRLKKLAQLLGRFRRLAISAQMTKVNHGFDEVFNITLGQDLNRVIPSELVLLRSEATKQEFARRFAEGKLQQYELRGKEKVGKGPIICCIDSSGSMSIEQDVWAKAVALALLEVAHRQGRAFATIHFGSRCDELKVVTIKKGEQNTIHKILEIAEYYLGGGTDFETPLDKALEIIEETDFKKADIVFTTDGECGVDEDWLDEFIKIRDEKEIRVHSVLIDAGNSSNHTVSQFSTEVSFSSDLTADNAIEIFEAV